MDGVYPYLLHFVAHGVLVENFPTAADPHERPFTENVVLPAINKIEERSSLRPLVCRLYP